MMDQGKQTNDFFHCFVDHTGRKSYRLKSLETYSKEHNVKETPSKKYFTATKFPDIIKGYSLGKKAGKPAEVQKGEFRKLPKRRFDDLALIWLSPSSFLCSSPFQKWPTEPLSSTLLKV